MTALSGRPRRRVGRACRLEAFEGQADATEPSPIAATRLVIVPALLTLAASMIYTGDFDDGERWLQRAGHALEADAGPGIWLLAHIVSGMMQAGRGRLPEAAGEFGAAECLRPQLTGSHALRTR